MKAVEKQLGTQIVILQRGWVFVGRLYKRGYACRLEGAAVIRRWGTTKGLGEIAEGGPNTNTILEPCARSVTFHYLTVVTCIECNGAKWSNILAS